MLIHARRYNLLESLEPRRLLSGFADAQDHDLTFDESGRLHLVYYDAAVRTLKYAARSLNGTWSTRAPIDPTDGIGPYASLAIDPQGRPAIAYFDAPRSDLKFARQEHGQWITTTVDSNGRAGLYPSLAFRQDGTPLISYYHRTRGDLRLASGGASWQISTIDSAGDVGRHSSLLIDPASGHWSVAYERTSDGSLLLARQTDDGIQHLQVDRVTKGFAYVSLATTGSLTAISYYDAKSRDLKFASSNDGGTWRALRVAVTGTQGLFSNLLLNDSGAAQIVHYNQSADTVVLSRQNGTSWLSSEVSSQGGRWVRAASFESSPLTLGLGRSATASLEVGDLPGIPSNVAASSLSDSAIELSWAGQSPAPDGYALERSEDGQTWNAIASLAGSVTTYRDEGLSEGTLHLYRVRATSSIGTSLESASAGAITRPIAPNSFTASPVAATKMDLAWTDRSSVESGYAVERSTDGISFVTIAELPPDASAYSDLGVLEATAYVYRVRARGAGGDSTRSTPAAATTVPAAPSQLATVVVSDEQIDLTWADNSAGESGYVVERSPDGVTFADIATLAANATSLSDTGLSEATEYTYRVRAYNAGGDSAASSSAAATTLPAAPTGLSSTAVCATQIDLLWTDNSSGESGFEVDRSSDGANWTQIASLAANATSYSDTSAPDGATSYYRVRAINISGGSNYSASTSASTVPLAPAGLTATAISTIQVDLSWSDVNGETGYEIERSNDSSAYTPLTVVAAGVTSYSDSGLSEGTPYYYRVRAVNAAGNSTYSTAANTTTPGSTFGTIHAHFSDGNGTASADQFAGIVGGGWSNAWQTSASSSTLTTSVKTYGSAGYSPLSSRGNHLDLNTMQSGGGTSNPAVGRQYTSFGGVTLTALHVIRFDLRIDTLGTFTNGNDRITIVDNTAIATGGTANSTWEIRAYGASTGTAVAGKWSFYNGIRNSEGAVNNTRWVSSTMNVVAGTTYSFTITTNPVTGSWDVAITASDGQAAVGSTNLGYRTSATTARSFLSFSVRTNANNETRDVSIDSLTADVS